MSGLDEIKKVVARIESEGADTIHNALPKTGGLDWIPALVALAIIGIMVWLGRDNVALLFQCLTSITIVSLIVFGACNITNRICQTWTRNTWVKTPTAPLVPGPGAAVPVVTPGPPSP